jgi:hypothetical protein
MAPSGSLVLLIVVLPQRVLTAVNENAAAKKNPRNPRPVGLEALHPCRD